MNDFNDGEFTPRFSFHVDEGELDSLTPQQIFVLGYECAQLVDWACDNSLSLYYGEEAERPFHSDNIDRIKAIMKELGIVHKIIMHDDWPSLVVYGKDK